MVNPKENGKVSGESPKLTLKQKASRFLRRHNPQIRAIRKDLPLLYRKGIPEGDLIAEEFKAAVDLCCENETYDWQDFVQVCLDLDAHTLLEEMEKSKTMCVRNFPKQRHLVSSTYNLNNDHVTFRQYPKRLSMVGGSASAASIVNDAYEFLRMLIPQIMKKQIILDSRYRMDVLKFMSDFESQWAKDVYRAAGLVPKGRQIISDIQILRKKYNERSEHQQSRKKGKSPYLQSSSLSRAIKEEAKKFETLDGTIPGYHTSGFHYTFEKSFPKTESKDDTSGDQYTGSGTGMREQIKNEGSVSGRTSRHAFIHDGGPKDSYTTKPIFLTREEAERYLEEFRGHFTKRKKEAGIEDREPLKRKGDASDDVK